MNLTDELRELLLGGTSIMLASRNAQMIPSLARAKGVRLLPGDPPRFRIFISTAHAGELIDDVRASGVLAANFSVPNTHRTVQFKGKDAKVSPVREDDRATLDAYVVAFADTIGKLGFTEDFTRAFFASPGDEVAIEFTPTDAFDQTPGPAAGARLE